MSVDRDQGNSRRWTHARTRLITATEIQLSRFQLRTIPPQTDTHDTGDTARGSNHRKIALRSAPSLLRRATPPTRSDSRSGSISRGLAICPSQWTDNYEVAMGTHVEMFRWSGERAGRRSTITRSSTHSAINVSSKTDGDRYPIALIRYITRE